MPTVAQRQRAAAAAAALASTAAVGSSTATTHARGHNQRSSVQKQRSQQSSHQTYQQQQRMSKQQSSQSQQPQQPQHPTKAQIKQDSSEEAAFSDEDSEEDETAVAFEMDSQDLWTQNFCATCDCLIEPGQGVGAATRRTKSDGGNKAPTSPLATTRQALPLSGLRSKSGTIKARPTSSEGSSSTTSNMKRTHSAGKLHAAGGTGVFGPHKRTGSAAGRLNALSELRPTTKVIDDGDTQKSDNYASSSSKKSASLPRQECGTQGGTQSNDSSRATSPISPNTNLPRTKKGGLIAAQARKFEEEVEELNAKAPAALYCSERCRSIDERRSSDLGELVYYLHQPTPTSPTWNNNSNLMCSSYNSWSNRAISMGYREQSSIGTPESECTCADCMDKHSVEGAVPSGASDTTESSASYQYGGRKQRTQSGRIVTPQNLAAPGGHGTDYFGFAANQKSQQQKQKQRRSDESRAFNEGDNFANVFGRDRNEYKDGQDVALAERPASNNTSARTMRDRGASVASDEAYGATTAGTVTPAAIRNSPECSNDSRLGMPDVQAMSNSQATTTSSPLRLIRRGDLRAQASVDVSGDLVKSQQTYPTSLLSQSVASEQTEMAASSGITLSTMNRVQSPFVPPSSSLLAEGRKTTLENPMQSMRMTNSPMPMENGTTSSAIGNLKNAQMRAAMQEDASHHPSLEERRQSIASTTSSSGSWLRASISSAWNSIRGYPQSGTNSSDDFSSVDEHHNESRRNSSSGSAASRFSAILPHGLGAMTPIAINHDDPTPTQSQIARPQTKRGNIPAFAQEIGNGSIPGDQQSSKEKNVEVQIGSQEMPSHLSKSYSSAHYTSDEERRRRRMEKEKRQRHQRSKDVTVLPPLLGVSRTASSVNVNKINRPSHYTHASYGSSGTNCDAMNQLRPRAGSQSQGLTSIANQIGMHPVGSNNGLSRPTTPSLRKNSFSTVTLAAPELASSPGGRIMSVGSFGSSPRRAGLGWGAMSTIASPDISQLPGTVSRPPSHASHRQHHHHHNHHNHHNHNGPNPPCINGGVQHPNRHIHRHSGGSSSNNLMRLGHVGLLGAHPHGSGPVYGRHATTPVRSTTPRVPEDGGEMSGAALKGEDDGSTLQIPSIHAPHPHRSSLMLQPPSRPHSSMSGRGLGHGEPHSVAPAISKRTSLGIASSQQRNMSSEDVRPVKLYPVLDVPNRKPTHDLYDANWHLDAALRPGAEESQQAAAKVDSQSRQAVESQQAQRKRLFYFDST